MYLGFVIVVLICGISAFLIYSGKSIEGLATLVTAVGGLVGAFMYATNSNRKEREEKKLMNNFRVRKALFFVQKNKTVYKKSHAKTYIFLSDAKMLDEVKEWIKEREKQLEE